MEFDAFMCCLNYSDFLRITIDNTRRQFDRILVVTSASDTETKKLCDQYKVQWTEFELMPRQKKFLFGSGLNYGYSVLNPKDWVCKLDADILLPENFRELVEPQLLNKNYIYGVRRQCIWKKTKYRKWLKSGGNFTISAKPVNINKIAQGFCQIFNSLSPNALQPLYGESGNASKIDNYFRARFDKTVHLGFDVIHLGPQSENWMGRISESWKDEEPFKMKT